MSLQLNYSPLQVFRGVKTACPLWTTGARGNPYRLKQMQMIWTLSSLHRKVNSNIQRSFDGIFHQRAAAKADVFQGQSPEIFRLSNKNGLNSRDSQQYLQDQRFLPGLDSVLCIFPVWKGIPTFERSHSWNALAIPDRSHFDLFYGGNFKSHSKNGFRCHSQRAAKGSLHLLPVR